MRTNLKQLAAMGEVLMGSQAGKRLFTKLIEIGEEPKSAEPCFLNFGGIKVATSSYLRESVVAFRDYCRQRRSNLYPVVANLSEAVREELDLFLRSKEDAMLSCALTSRGATSDIELLGSLDPKSNLAFRVVQDLGATDATSIWKKYQAAERITVNAWNNRLAALSGQGIVVEEPRGRTKLYRPVLKEG